MHRVMGHPGTMVLWDSRTIHANQPPRGKVDRSVAYVCMIPNVASNAILNKRAKYFSENRTTNHHPVRVQVNPDSLMRFHKGLDPKEVVKNLPKKEYTSFQQMALVKGLKDCTIKNPNNGEILLQTIRKEEDYCFDEIFGGMSEEKEHQTLKAWIEDI